MIPTLNEEKGIAFVLKGVEESLASVPHCVLVVDGNSTDNTLKIADALGAKQIIQAGIGYGDAYLSGFKYLEERMKSDVVVMIDGDGSYDAMQIPLLIQPILRGEADMVIGDRFSSLEDGSMTWVNRVGNRFISWFARKGLGIRINDTQCGFRAFRSSFLPKMNFRSAGMPFAVEMIVEGRYVGMKIIEARVSYKMRVGKTKLRPLRDGLRILGVIIRLTRDHEPLLFFGGIGLIFSLAGITFGLSVFLEWLSTGTVIRIPTAILSSVLIITGIQIFMFGLLADMVRDVKDRVRSLLD